MPRLRIATVVPWRVQAGLGRGEKNGAGVSLEQLRDYFRTYDRGVYRVMAGGRGAPSEARLEAFEKNLDFRLPEQFREFVLSPLGGLSMEVLEDLWPRSGSDARTGPQAQFGFKVFGLAIPIPDWLDLREEILRLPEDEGDLVPFMARTGTDDRYCFDLDHQIVLWSPRDGSRKAIPLTFYELLEEEIADLARRHQILRCQPASRRGKSRRTSG